MDSLDKKFTTSFYLTEIENKIDAATSLGSLDLLYEILQIIAAREEKVSSSFGNLEEVECGRFTVLKPVAGLHLCDIIRLVEDRIEEFKSLPETQDD